MREIKFRFWSNHLGKFVVPDDSIFVGALKDPDMNTMQYTGLKDKNGVDIYEGDIVQMGPFVYSVVWIASAAFTLKHNNPLQTRGVAVTHAVTHGEVIGNIYENPELL